MGIMGDLFTIFPCLASAANKMTCIHSRKYSYGVQVASANKTIHIFYTLQSCGKVMFSWVSVCPHGGRVFLTPGPFQGVAYVCTMSFLGG